MLIGERVEKYKDKLGWTTAELARQTGVSHAAIWKIERDQNGISIDAAIKIADAFKITLGELLGIEYAPARAAKYKAFAAKWDILTRLSAANQTLILKVAESMIG